MADDKKKKDEEGGDAAPEGKPKGKKKLFIIVGLVVVIAAIGVPFALMGGDKTEGAEAGEEEVEEEKTFLTFEMDTFIVNLSDSSSFLKTKILVEYDPSILEKLGGHGEGGGGSGGGHGGGGAGGGDEAAKGGVPAALAPREPMIKDSIIRVLSSKKKEDVLTAEGKDRLKEELIEAINEATGLDEGPVVSIYFTEFIVQ